ncbi:hypothetical protein ACFQ60_04600 [Streptomyces zhihengii]|uniref:Integral membrane protein n=1 Tax=Streptomyces zhihengii TaxID=1818004 RepID=A0ABS2V1W9_9ACTN|nr:hypothetical protein [Streptomyces zhihengii]MBM9623839.1 hypothetical protein [Streptomyces zhihengii]
MPTVSPRGDRKPPDELERARLWLAGHGLGEIPPTAALARRLAVRQSCRLAGSLLLAGFILAVALVYTVSNDPATDPSGPSLPPSASLLLLTAVVAGLVAVQALLDRRVRRIDRQVAAALPRRAAHPVRVGWRAVLGRPRAALVAGTFAGAAALTAGALTSADPGVRYGAAVVLIALCGVAAVVLVQLRHVLTRPAVADDEASLTADVILRIEDARETATPTMVWCLPWYLPTAAAPGTAFGWWTVSWIVLIVVGAVVLVAANLADHRRGGLAAAHRERLVNP